MKVRKVIRFQHRSDSGSIRKKKKRKVGESIIDFILVLRKFGKVIGKSRIKVGHWKSPVPLRNRPALVSSPCSVINWKVTQ